MCVIMKTQINVSTSQMTVIRRTAQFSFCKHSRSSLWKYKNLWCDLDQNIAKLDFVKIDISIRNQSQVILLFLIKQLKKSQTGNPDYVKKKIPKN